MASQAPGAETAVRPHQASTTVPAATADISAHALLAEAGRRLSGSLNERRCLRAVAELTVAHLADGAVVVGPPEGSARAMVRLASGGRVEEFASREDDLAQVPGLLAVLNSTVPAPSQRLASDAVPATLLPEGAGQFADLLLVPLPGTAAPGGALLMARSAGRGGFDAHDRSLAVTFALHAGAAVSAATHYREQSEAMAVLQAELLPPELASTDRMELAGSYQPAVGGLLVGGDFYDVFPPAGATGSFLVLLGDVCGKGAAAAALTGKVRQTLRALHLVEQDPSTLLRVLNEAMRQRGEDGQFVTLVAGSVIPSDHGRLRMTFATGGHPAPLVLRGDGSVAEVPATGSLIGVVPELHIRTATIDLAPGELCLLYSDGVTEARGGASGIEQYGEQRLRRALGTCHGMPTAATLERLRQLVSDWVHGGLRDDIAMLAVRARSAGSH
jgi:serine phosphatase RsbU (regulator of sigma subunit)